MKKWLDMAKLGDDFRKKIELLERNFSVSCVIFNKFKPIFFYIFTSPTDEQAPKSHKGKKRKQGPTIQDIFNFCWTLYIRAKGNFPAISDDLVNSYHLLLCCLDLTFANVLTSSVKSRKAFLNPKFKDLPKNYMEEDIATDDIPNTIQTLCEAHDGIPLESKQIREHYWKPFVKRLFEKEVLQGDDDDLLGLFETHNFDYNWKHINVDYDEHVLSTGDFDERVFLGEDAGSEIGTPSKSHAFPKDVDEGERMHLRRNLQESFSKAPLTPLTGRKYLGEKDPRITPVSTATQSVSRLQAMLQGRKPGPSDTLKAMFSDCTNDPEEKLQKYVEELGETFILAYTQGDGDILNTKPREYLRKFSPARAGLAYVELYKKAPRPDRPNSPCSTREFANNRLKLANILFYKILESILLSEKKRLGNIDIASLLEQEIFVKSLMASCLEIVIFSYNSQRTFPWILEAFEISSFSFYKVIEVVIREEEGLSRDAVKHLNQVEEQILEKLVWETGSPVYIAIKAAGKIPSCEDVSLQPPSGISGQRFNIEGTSSATASPTLLSPIIQRQLYRMVEDKAIGVTRPGVPQSPIVPLNERFGSPSSGTAAKRNLFGSPTSAGQSPSSSSTSASVNVTTHLTSAGKATIIGTLVQGKTLLINSGKPAAGSGRHLTVVVPYRMTTASSPNTTPVQSPIKQPRSASNTPQKSTGQLSVSASTSAAKAHSGSPAKTKKIGSLGLFFRKVYHLASVRIIELCRKLDVSDSLIQRVWTCFEYGMVNRIELLQDRHLDQFLMCAVYVMSKVTREDRTFHEIMKCYRQQPQAASHVYRRVLIKKVERSSTNSSTNEDKPKTPSTPEKTGKKTPEQQLTPTRTTRSASKAAKEEGKPDTPDKTKEKPEEKPKLPEDDKNTERENISIAGDHYGDLIEFYNVVFIKEIKDFALKFAPNTKSLEAPPLSPLPARRCKVSSPRKVSDRHEVYVSPIKRNVPLTPGSMLYCFEKSPAKKLRDINDMISQHTRTPDTRRRLSMVDNEDGLGPSPPKRLPESNGLTRRLQELTKDRVPNHR